MLVNVHYVSSSKLSLDCSFLCVHPCRIPKLLAESGLFLLCVNGKTFYKSCRLDVGVGKQSRKTSWQHCFFLTFLIKGFIR